MREIVISVFKDQVSQLQYCTKKGNAIEWVFFFQYRCFDTVCTEGH